MAPEAASTTPTTRIYYTDPSRRTFDARIEACVAAGTGFEVRLDQTAFYPTSGGQPFDVGHLGGARVLDVIDADDDTVVHIVDRELPTGATVTGEVDWPRRFDHMQQHTGQHILSAAFDGLHGVRTTSFHLGATSATIDLAREVSPAEIARAETQANDVVWDDRPVMVRFVSAEEAAALPLRKEPVRPGRLRLIEVADFDLSACGGTHVATTGAIGVIAIAGWEKFKGGSRVEFVCGGRALRRFREWRDVVTATSRLLSVAPGDVAAGIERLQAEAKSSLRTARGALEQLAVHEGRALLARGVAAADRRVVIEALEGWDAAGLKALAAAAVAADVRAVVVLFSASTPAVVVAARGADARVDCSAVVKRLLAAFGGRGGGRPELAQGGGLDASPAALVAAAGNLLAND